MRRQGSPRGEAPEWIGKPSEHASADARTIGCIPTVAKSGRERAHAEPTKTLFFGGEDDSRRESFPPTSVSCCEEGGRWRHLGTVSWRNDVPTLGKRPLCQPPTIFRFKNVDHHHRHQPFFHFCFNGTLFRVLSWFSVKAYCSKYKE